MGSTTPHYFLDGASGYNVAWGANLMKKSTLLCLTLCRTLLFLCLLSSLVIEKIEHFLICLQANNWWVASVAPALSVINFSIEQSTVPQITHKRSENLAASGNCLGCIINIAWYLQEKRGILQEMLHTKDFVCRKSLKDFNGYCSPSTSLYYISHLDV